MADKVGVIGGGELFGRLAELGIINEIILDVEPVVLGGGTRLFGEHALSMHLRLLASKQFGASGVQNRYRIEC